MAALFALREDFAIRTCFRMVTRSSLASFLSSVSDSGVNGWAQRVRMREQSSSMRASVEGGTAKFYRE